ncbi:hypothetical protein AN218_06305 [Streptomyces nanshensis]|uniref:Thioesterase TesA-like domain-containing protein n=1 Tax=Streptomyces nanshensis TaxID=518642 RepID=A0A1E7L9I6_9ACTN|nr:hypothetical protein AN218_06305 [Streptomyces nanshensis]
MTDPKSPGAYPNDAARATASWLRCQVPRPEAELCLICLPHAGGSASFYKDWPRLLPEGIEVRAVQYPGREDRFDEECTDDMDVMADAVARAVLGLGDRRFALFGHSMGAAVAYETARRIERVHQTEPVKLIVSGRHAPHQAVHGDVHLRDDDAVVDELVRLGGTDGVLLRDPEMQSVFLPVIRSDFRLAETYRHTPGTELRCPVTAVIGDSDPEVDEVQASGWASHTSGAFALHTLPGDHFYLTPERDALLDLVTRELGAAKPVGRA